MMLQPLLSNAAKQAVATTVAVPPPIGGWNDSTALDLMPAEDATRLENWFPRTSDVVLRGGFTALSTSAMGSGAAVETLAELRTNTVNKLVAASGGKIYDATGATPAQLATGYSEDRWQTHAFKNLLFACNGTDAPWTYNGSAFDATSGFTGPTITTLIDVTSHAERLFFVEKDSQSFWYGGVGAITGALTEFNLNTIAQLGGNLNSIGIIASDGGVSSENLVCFFMTSGEVIIYQGSNPGDASAWSKVGSFVIGAPFNRQNSLSVGADLVAMTMDGFVPMTQVLPFGRSRDERAILSDKIRGAVNAAVKSYKGNAHWQIQLYPLGDMLIFNIPVTGTTAEQYVMNTTTGSWAKFKNMNARCWALLSDDLYFGGEDGKIYQADTGTDDAGSAIPANGATAWNYFGDRGRQKQFTAARPNFTADGTLTLSTVLNVDFVEKDVAHTVTSLSTGPIWDAVIWDEEIWGGALGGVNTWQSIMNIGYAASLRVEVSTSTLEVHWNSTTYTMIPGGVF
jgi:hypothetical protein